MNCWNTSIVYKDDTILWNASLISNACFARTMCAFCNLWRAMTNIIVFSWAVAVLHVLFLRVGCHVYSFVVRGCSMQVFCKCCLLQAFVWMRSSLEMWGLWYCAFSCPANRSWCLHVYTICLAPSTVAMATFYGACICDTVKNSIKWECHAIVAWHWHF